MSDKIPRRQAIKEVMRQHGLSYEVASALVDEAIRIELKRREASVTDKPIGLTKMTDARPN